MLTKLTRDILPRDVELKVVSSQFFIMMLSDPRIAGNLGEAYTHGRVSFSDFLSAAVLNDSF